MIRRCCSKDIAGARGRSWERVAQRPALPILQGARSAAYAVLDRARTARGRVAQRGPSPLPYRRWVVVQFKLNHYQAVSRLGCDRGCMPGANGIECPVRAPDRSYLVAPIMTRNRTYGWMGLSNKVGNLAFSADDERLLGALVAQLAVAYENSRLFEELKRRAAELEREATERRQQAEKYRMLIEQASDGIL